MKTGKKILLAATVTLMMIFAMAFVVLADDELVIKTQPSDQHVDFPEVARFSVEVAGDSSDLTYQWIMVNSGIEYVLESESAKTATLNVTTRPEYGNEGVYEYYCVITDKNGNSVDSDPAGLYVKNYNDNKTAALYVGDVGIAAGEEVDLAEAGVGSGKVSLSEDASKVVFDNVKYSNENLKDIDVMPGGVAVYYESNDISVREVELQLIGDNSITNTYYESGYDEGGFALYFEFNRYMEELATLTVDGEGTLTVNGGTHMIDVNSNLVFDNVKVWINSVGTYMSNGIETNCTSTQLENGVPDVSLKNGTEIIMNVNGTGIFSDGTLTIEDSVLDITETVPWAISGYTSKQALLTNGIVLINASKVTVNANVYKDTFKDEDKGTAGCGIISVNGGEFANLVIENESEVNISLTFEKGDRLYNYAPYMIGVDGSIFVENSTLNSTLSAKEAAIGINAIYTKNNFIITDSTVSSYASGYGTCNAISVSGKLQITDSYVAANAEADDYQIVEVVENALKEGLLGEDEQEAAEVVKAKNAALLGFGVEINLDKAGTYVLANAPGGQSILSGMCYSYDQTDYEEGYEPESIILTGDNLAVTSADGKTNQSINLYSYDLSQSLESFLICEAMYNEGDKAAPAENTLIKAGGVIITEQPEHVYAAVGSQATLKVAAESTTGSELTYQWMRFANGEWVKCTSAGSDTAQFTFKMYKNFSGRMYMCIVTDAEGNTAGTRAVLVSVPFEIKSQPEDITAVAGDNVSLSVTAAGSNLIYQWEYTTDGVNWKECTSANSSKATFKFKAYKSFNGRTYRCVVTDAAGNQLVSDTASVTVTK